MQEEGRAQVKSAWRNRALFALIGVGVFGLDQITKDLALERFSHGRSLDVVGSLLRFRVSFNSGGAFGLLQDKPIFFLLAASVIVAVVGIWAWRGLGPAFALGLIFGGGLGNLFDRVTRGTQAFKGEVIDFIQLPYWPTFNIADSAILLGVAILLWDSFRQRKQGHSKPDQKGGSGHTNKVQTSEAP